jgi:large subunit ribosomal protein L25
VEFELHVEARTGSGRSDNRRLRKVGKVPAIVYGGGAEPRAVSVDHDTLIHQMEREAFYTTILTLKLGENTEPVVVKDVQRHPYRTQVLHLDFQRIVADEIITLHVPIHFIGEEAAVGVKQQGGIAERLITDVEVSCLPKDLPAYLEIDVHGVELNDIVHLSDIVLPEGVTLEALEHGSDQPVFTISPPRREEEEEVAEAEIEEAGEVPTITEEEEDESEPSD